MATIGNIDFSGLGGASYLPTETQLLVTLAAEYYTAAANQEVTSVSAHFAATGTLEVGVYDITAGVDAATLVVAGTILAGSNNATATQAVPETPLVEGNIYTVGFRAVTSLQLSRAYSGGGSVNRHATLTGADALTTWAQGTGWDKRYAVSANTETGTLDIVNPSLDNESVGSKTGSGGVLSVDTNEDTGTLFYIDDTNATRTELQMEAGSSQTVTAAGTQTTPLTTSGVTGQSRFFHAMHKDAAGNNSNIVTVAYTTNAASLPYAPYAVQIKQPEANLDTKNRFYKTYTGLEYNVKTAVKGGNFSELVYALTTSPSGMVIDAVTGVISWPNPTETGSPHTVTVSVTDGNTTDTVTWPLTVGTDNALFVDPQAASSGAGTLASPFNSWLDFYEATEGASTYADNFIYCRAGNHVVESNATTANNGAQWGTQKPVVFIGYPGERPRADFANEYIFADTACDNFYFDGFDVINVAAHSLGDRENMFAFRIFGDNITFRRNKFEDIPDFPSSYNQAYIMAVSHGAKNESWSLTENYCDGEEAKAYALCVLYDTIDAVIESNTLVNIGNIGIGIKTRNDGAAIRGNHLTGSGRHIWLYNEFGAGGLHEVSWNYGKSTGSNSFRYNDAYVETPLGSHMIRNTFSEDMFYRILRAGDGIIYEVDNVVISSDPNNHDDQGGLDETRIDQSGNLVNATEDSFLDPITTLLIGAFASQNATKGCNGFAGLKTEASEHTAPVGQPDIDIQAPKQGDVLTSSIGTLVDAEIIDVSTITRQWQANQGDVIGAIGTSYNTAGDAPGTRYRVGYSFDDTASPPNSYGPIYSDETAPLAGVGINAGRYHQPLLRTMVRTRS